MDTMTAAPTSSVATVDDSRTPLPLRGDTFLGVCEALGQDFGLPPNLLRLAFASLFFWSMPIGVGAYLAIGALVAAVRWMYPARTAAEAAMMTTDGSDTDAASESQELPLAA